MKTFLVNLKNHCYQQLPLFLGGGEFSPYELENVVSEIEKLQQKEGKYQQLLNMLQASKEQGEQTASYILRQISYPHTLIALRDYDDGFLERNRLWTIATTEIEIDFADSAGRKATEKVCEAYYKDTSETNTLEQCLLLSVPDIRKIIS
jgi:hypothetical protein